MDIFEEQNTDTFEEKNRDAFDKKSMGTFEEKSADTTEKKHPEAKEISAQIKPLEQQLLEEIDFEKIKEFCNYLSDAIQDILQSCGLYFRIFSRVKTADSLARKLLRGRYGTENNPKKIQDLIGIRVVLYYYDDMSICREIMGSTFQLIGEWTRSLFKENTFEATKTNGVFRFPFEYCKSYKRSIWTFPIDTTFELQLRTVFFEGWHEIEHDMRYKSLLNDKEFWKGSEELSRILNCILANLELSDWSLVELFNQLSYNHYKGKNWDLMLKSKFRIHMSNEETLDSEIIRAFDEDPLLARQFFKADRKVIIKELLTLNHPKITHNLIIKLINDKQVKNAKIAEICDRIHCIKPAKTHQKAVFSKLHTDRLFHLELPLLHKETRKTETEFHNAASILYKWARFKLNPVFETIPAALSSYTGHLPGYDLKIVYDPDRLLFSLTTNHIDNQIIGTLWHTRVSIRQTREDALYFLHDTSRDSLKGVSQPSFFHKPSYLADLSGKIGLVDIVRLGSKAKYVHNDETLSELISLIRHRDRKLPVVVIAQNLPDSSETTVQNDDWDYDMNTFTINGTRLAKVVGHYCHVYMTDYTWNHSFGEAFSISRDDSHGCIAIFWPQEDPQAPELFTSKMVHDAQFDFNRFAFHKNIHEKAFRHKLVQMIKEHHVNEQSS